MSYNSRQKVLVSQETIPKLYDEESNLFKEPVSIASRPTSAKVRKIICGGLLCLGMLGLTISFFETIWVSLWLWVVSYALLAAGITGSLWFSYRETGLEIKNDRTFFSGVTNRGIIAWFFAVIFTGFYGILYWWPAYLDQLFRVVDPLSWVLAGQSADQWFLYGFLYTIAVLIFGFRSLIKYRNNRYHIFRTISVMMVQLILAFILPQILRSLNEPEFYFSYFWPLKYEILFPESVDNLISDGNILGTFMLYWGIIGSFLATPILTYFYGKRWYCSWICGCGGLAETMGDPWRHLMPSSSMAWRIERGCIYTVLIIILLTTGFLWISSLSGGFLSPYAAILKEWYGFYIGAIFAGVIGVGFYPILGSRIWCRFGCPMAAILGIIQRFYSRFRITTNGGQCISCGNCTTYCEMGIDVRSYAERGENIVRASCVGCGVCSSVCPRGVLKLENGTSYRNRYPGSDKPLSAVLTAFKGGGCQSKGNSYL